MQDKSSGEINQNPCNPMLNITKPPFILADKRAATTFQILLNYDAAKIQ